MTKPSRTSEARSKYEKEYREWRKANPPKEVYRCWPLEPKTKSQITHYWWYQKNKEKRAIQVKAWRKANRPIMRAIDRRYRDKNRERIRELNTEHYWRHRDKILVGEANRRSR